MKALVRVVLTLLMTPFFIRAMELEDFNRIKAANTRILTECVDLENQNPFERIRAKELRDSLGPFLDAQLTKADLARGITAHLAGVGMNSTHAALAYVVRFDDEFYVPSVKWNSTHP